MPLRTSLALPLLALAILLAACGEDTATSGGPTADGLTIYVRAAGMVQSDGIT